MGEGLLGCPFKSWAIGHCPLGLAASCSLPTQHATGTDPLTTMLPQDQRKLAQYISQGDWGAGMLRLEVAKLTAVFFLTPGSSSPPLHSFP